MENALMGPVLAQVALTLVVLLWLYARRLPAMAAMKPTNEQMQDKGNLQHLPAPARFVAENYSHQFEAPILFYALCIGAMAAGIGSGLTLSLAWGFVALRAVHTLIHCTYNKVMHRFAIFSLSCFVLIAIFVELAFAYWGA